MALPIATGPGGAKYPLPPSANAGAGAAPAPQGQTQPAAPSADAFFGNPIYTPPSTGGWSSQSQPAAPAPQQESWRATHVAAAPAPTAQPQGAAGGQEAGWGNQPWYAEQQWLDAKDQWSQPSAAQQQWEGIKGSFKGGFDPLRETNAEKSVNEGAGLDPYFDRASKVGGERLANKFAAMGLTGSSGTTDALASMEADLGAQQAFKEADYRLAANAAADKGYFDRANTNLGFEGFGMNSAMGVSSDARADRIGAMSSAATAGQERRGREGDAFQQQFDMNSMLADLYFKGSGGALDADRGLFDDEQESYLAPYAAERQKDRQDRDDLMGYLGLGMKGYELYNNRNRTGNSGGGQTG